MRKLSIERGRIEIWAAAIVYVIARLNFLFDPENEVRVTADEMCAFFNTKKTTIGNKAGLIQKACNLYLGNTEFSAPEIVNMLRLYETEEGFLVPGSMLDAFEDILPAGKESRSAQTEIKAEERGHQRSRVSGKSKPHDTDEKEDRNRQLKLFDDS